MTSSSFYEEGSKLLTPGAFEFVLDSELKRAGPVPELPDARDRRSQPRMGRHDGHGRRRHAAGGGADHRPRGARHRSARPHREGHARARAARRRLRSLLARHRSPGLADRELRVPDRAADRGRRRLLSHPRRRRRFAEAAGAVAADRQLARRRPLVRRSATEGARHEAHTIHPASRRRHVAACRPLAAAAACRRRRPTDDGGR